MGLSDGDTLTRLHAQTHMPTNAHADTYPHTSACACSRVADRGCHQPHTPHLQRLRQAPMVERHHGGDPSRTPTGMHMCAVRVHVRVCVQRRRLFEAHHEGSPSVRHLNPCPPQKNWLHAYPHQQGCRPLPPPPPAATAAGPNGRASPRG